LKKQKAKKAGGAKKKEEKTEAPAEAEASTPTDQPGEKLEEPAVDAEEAAALSPAPVEDDDEPSELAAPKASHARKPSVAIESRQRSESFYRSGAAGTPTSPGAVTPGAGITSEMYREQALRIDELERENRRLASEVEDGETRWKKGEEELEDLREGRGDVALAVEKGKEADKLVCAVIRIILGADTATESRSRVAQAAVVPGSISKHENHAPYFDRLAHSILFYRRLKCASRVQVCDDRIAGARDFEP
jgi:hypothetical protein